MSEKKSVWETLSKINVNDHTETKQGLTYLSWAWAWGVLKNHYPSATFTKHIHEGGVPFIKDSDGNAYVTVTVTVEGESVTELFPVLDYKNKSIKNPDSFAVNTAMQRALAKAISYHGLGHYIYAGEDLPQDDGPVSASGGATVGGVSAAGATTTKNKGATPEAVQAAYENTPDVRGPDGTPKATTGWDMVTSVFTEFLPMCETEASLKKFWGENKEVVQQLKTAAPSLYVEVVEAFTKRKAAIKE